MILLTQTIFSETMAMVLSTDKITDAVNYTPWFSMGADAGDINNDGMFDFVALDMAALLITSQRCYGEMGVMRWVIEATNLVRL